MISNKPILVTGSHRSGTTWVGRMIAADPSVVYIHEPFNISLANKNKGICGAPFDYWFTYVTQENGQAYYNNIKRTIELRYNLPDQLLTVRSPKKLLKPFKEAIYYSKQRKVDVRVLMKDPIAFFSSEWLAETFSMDVVVMIRHPAAFAGSLKVKDWRFPFSHFLEQPLLLEAYLHPFEAEIAEFAEKEQDIIDQAALLWKLIHYVILQYQEKYQDWIFIRHEELSQDPLAGFRSLYSKLKLDYSAEVEQTIKAHSMLNSKPSATDEKLFSTLQRDSTSNVWTWKERLTPEEICRIKERVGQVSSQFYSSEAW